MDCDTRLHTGFASLNGATDLRMYADSAGMEGPNILRDHHCSYRQNVCRSSRDKEDRVKAQNYRRPRT